MTPRPRCGRRRAAADGRRGFLRGCAAIPPALLLGAWAAPLSARAAAASTTLVPPRRRRGAARIDVRDTGALGDGRHDDTAALQAAIDALPAAGGTVHVPAGTYLIDAERSVRLRSRMHLELSPDARLIAKPNGARKYFVVYVFQVSDVEISGGRISGERARHRGSDGEWGHGIQIRGSWRVTVRDIGIADCWGDGVYIGSAGKRNTTPSEDVVIANIRSTGNRRQGLSICESRNVRVHDCEFSDTEGTNPQYGIDIEPNRPGTASGIHIENCLIRNNHGGGIQLFKRVSDVTIKDCTIEHNHGRGILAVSASNGLIVGNRIHDNGKIGVVLREQSRNFQVRGNRFYNNETRGRRPAKKSHLQSGGRPSSAVRAADGAHGIQVTGNLFEAP